MTNDKNEKKNPLEIPSVHEATKVDPIVDVVDSEIFPKVTKEVENIISKPQQE